MRDKVVTVFGGSGFIGRYVIKRLADLDATIRVPTRDPNRAMFLRPMGAVGQVVLEPWEPGLTALPRLIEGCTHVVNLIGILAERRRGEFEAVQAQLPGEIAAAAKAAGVTRLVSNGEFHRNMVGLVERYARPPAGPRTPDSSDVG